MTHKSQAGMTLVELIVVVTILGILASIAIPSYRNYVIRTNRTEAKTALLSAAANLERCYTQRLAYNTCPIIATMPYQSETGNYEINVAMGMSPTQYTLTATPKQGQVKDTGCGTLGVTEVNARMASGSKGAAECWGH